MTTPIDNQKSLTRREALKTLAAVTGAATLASLPGQWETPLVEVGALPAHAQTSNFSIQGLHYPVAAGQIETEDVGFARNALVSYSDPAALFVKDTAYLFAALTNCGTTLFNWEPLSCSAINSTGSSTSGSVLFTFPVSNACWSSQLCVQLKSAGRTSNQLCATPTNSTF